MILHASVHWKYGIDASLWPMAAQYAVNVYNNTPGDNAIYPADIFTGGTVPRHRLRDIHVWGIPVYVLDPKLQQGQKFTRWQPCSRCGMFLGLSQEHSSEVPQVLIFSTGRFTTQYHVVVFYDLFTTVPSIEREHEPHHIGTSSVWMKLFTFQWTMNQSSYNMSGSPLRKLNRRTGLSKEKILSEMLKHRILEYKINQWTHQWQHQIHNFL
jgi:hypothetical protein